MGQTIPSDVVREAARRISSGGILLYPTDTVYGIGGDAANQEANRRIRALKGLGLERPILILTDSWDRVSDWFTSVGSLTSRLMRLSLEYPVTILFPATDAAPRSLIGNSPEIGIRLCRLPFCRELIERSGRPLSSTSANQSGGDTPVDIGSVPERILSGVDLVVDGGRLDGLPSTIVRVVNEGISIVREGSLPADELKDLLF